MTDPVMPLRPWKRRDKQWRYAQRKALGVCWQCGAEAFGRAECPRHEAQRKARKIRQRQWLIEHGKCTNCLKVRGEGGTAQLCRRCADTINLTMQIRRGKVPMAEPTRDDLARWCDTIRTEGVNLTKWEETFVTQMEHLLAYDRHLSERQAEILERIYSERTP